MSCRFIDELICLVRLDFKEETCHIRHQFYSQPCDYPHKENEKVWLMTMYCFKDTTCIRHKNDWFNAWLFWQFVWFDLMTSHFQVGNV